MSNIQKPYQIGESGNNVMFILPYYVEEQHQYMCSAIQALEGKWDDKRRYFIMNERAWDILIAFLDLDNALTFEWLGKFRTVILKRVMFLPETGPIIVSEIEQITQL